jgi:hypothetical protein
MAACPRLDIAGFNLTDELAESATFEYRDS